MQLPSYCAEIEHEVREQFLGESTGHDWWHIHRVRNNARAINKSEAGDPVIVELGALLHDIADFKFHDGDESIGPRRAKEMMQKYSVPDDIQEAVVHIVANTSYKGAKVANTMTLKEGFIVQDADRLDAIGAIGIGRVFAYGGSKGRDMYDPTSASQLHTSADAYKNNTSSSIAHFYEKLLLLKDKMNTETGKKLAQERHSFLELFLQEFLDEWEGKK